VSVAQENALKGAKLGFAFDRGFGAIGTMDKFNLFIGNDGAAVDYLFKNDPLKTDLKGPVSWYIGGGAYADWDSDRGVRLPVGLQWRFVREFDMFAQLIPRLRLNNDARFGLDAAIGIRYLF
jgi:hypothetical protein